MIKCHKIIILYQIVNDQTASTKYLRAQKRAFRYQFYDPNFRKKQFFTSEDGKFEKEGILNAIGSQPSYLNLQTTSVCYAKSRVFNNHFICGCFDRIGIISVNLCRTSCFRTVCFKNTSTSTRHIFNYIYW